MKLLGSDIICEALLREGVEVVFGHPGGAVLPLYDAFYRYQQIRHILVRHEQCVATSGPGATNLITGIMAAKADSVPMVAITGQVPRPMIGTEAFQECDTCAISAPCTKKSYLVTSVEELAPTLYDAFRLAQEGRPGPTLVDIPRDVQQELCEFQYLEVPYSRLQGLTSETQANLHQAAQLIDQAERPLIIAGHGIVASRAWDELQELAEKTGIPVINTLLGLGSFPRNHPLSMGMLGMHGMYWANLAVDQADLIIGLGIRFDDRITGRPGSFAPRAKIIHADIEASQIGRNVPVEVPLVGDVGTVLQGLLPLVGHVQRHTWMDYLGNLKRDHPSLAIPESQGLMAQDVLLALNQLIQEDEDVVVTTGVGQHQMWAAQFLFFNQKNSFVTSAGLGAMGYELPSAMGAQVGRPKATVWSIAGDGGFQMTMQELATVIQERLPVKIALFNNGMLGMVRQWQEMFYDKHYSAVPVPGPDFVKLAQAFGIAALRVEENPRSWRRYAMHGSTQVPS